ncbi:MAG: radical SAM protein [Planctomycetota bacterium]
MTWSAKHLLADIVRTRLGSKRPFKLTFALTERCYHRCMICRLWESSPNGGPATDEVCRVFAMNRFFSWINLTGGELTARRDIETILATLLQTQPRLELLQFPTAGWLPEPTESIVRFLLQRGVPRLAVTVSVDGDRATHDRLRGRTGAYERAITTLARLRAISNRRLRVLAGLTLSRFNAHHVEDAIAALRAPPLSLSADEIHINLAHHSRHSYHNSPDVKPPAETMPPLARLTSRWPLGPVPLVETLYRRLTRRHQATGRCPLPCQAARASLHVGADLEVRPCSTWDRSLGNLRDHGFDLVNLLATTETEQVQREIAAEKCPGCWTPCDAAPTLLVKLPEAVARAFTGVRTNGTHESGGPQENGRSP